MVASQAALTSFFSMVLTLFFVVDPFGAIQNYITYVGAIRRKEHYKLIVRELFLALALMIFFHYFGRLLFSLLGLKETTVTIAGGIVLFLISIRLIFPGEEHENLWEKNEKPFLVPIATPFIAGPSVLAVIMIFSQRVKSEPLMLSIIFVAWLISAILLFFAPRLYHLLREKGISALEKLTGLIVAMIALQQLLEGIKLFIATR